MWIFKKWSSVDVNIIQCHECHKFDNKLLEKKEFKLKEYTQIKFAETKDGDKSQ